MNILEYIPKDCVCTRLFIVGPYPMSSYIARLRKELRKKQSENCMIIIYADESWNDDEVEKLEENESTVILVHAYKPVGLVHAKMYFLECRDGNGDSHYILITGSGNASKNGMDNNAEVMTIVQLSLFEDDIQKDIENYFKGFVEKNCNEVGEIIAELKRGSSEHKIILPRLIKSEKSHSFYSWLRSGYLFYQYVRDPNFGFILYNLKKGLKVNKGLLNLIKSSGFESGKGALQIIRHPYIAEIKDKTKGEKDEAKGKKILNALSTYAIETAYGYWVSKECFNEMQDIMFPKKDYLDLKTVVDDVNVGHVIKEVRKGLEKLNNAKKFKEYIDKAKLKKIDNLVYGKIKRDREMASDDNFVSRYNFGFASHKMPSLDETDFKEFCDSFMSTILIKSKGSKKKNRLVQKLLSMDFLTDLEEMQDDDCENDNERLEKWLCDNWDEQYRNLKKYYKNENCIVLQKQKYDKDSGIACVAMLLGLPYKNVFRKAEKEFGQGWGEKNSYYTDNAKIRDLFSALGSPLLGNFTKKSWSDIDGRNLIAIKRKGEYLHWIVAERLKDEVVTIYDPEIKKGKEKPIEQKDRRWYKIYKCLQIPVMKKND